MFFNFVECFGFSVRSPANRDGAKVMKSNPENVEFWRFCPKIGEN